MVTVAALGASAGIEAGREAALESVFGAVRPRFGVLGEVAGRDHVGGWAARLLTDDSVFGVVELQSVRGVGELR
jgi:hypothetical protein